MNGRAARLMRLLVKVSGVPYRAAKRGWTQSPWRDRRKMRASIEAVARIRRAGSVRAETWPPPPH